MPPDLGFSFHVMSIIRSTMRLMVLACGFLIADSIAAFSRDSPAPQIMRPGAIPAGPAILPLERSGTRLGGIALAPP
jgi:hypothetical protein